MKGVAEWTTLVSQEL